MGRSHINTILQHDGVSCGPASIQHTLKIFNKRKSTKQITKLCKTNRNGTSTKNMIAALNTIGFTVLSIEKATLRHLVSALRYSPTKPRAVIVSYLYDKNIQNKSFYNSGHWATVSSFSASKNRITVFDSNSGKKRSYPWYDFRNRWKDFDVKRIYFNKTKSYKYIKKWQKQLILIVAKDEYSLPKFHINTAQLFPPRLSQ